MEEYHRFAYYLRAVLLNAGCTFRDYNVGVTQGYVTACTVYSFGDLPQLHSLRQAGQGQSGKHRSNISIRP